MRMPKRVCDSQPRSISQIRKEQEKYLKWERTRSDNGNVGWKFKPWAGPVGCIGELLPTVLVREVLLDAIKDGLVDLPARFDVTPYSSGQCSRLFLIEFPANAPMSENLPRSMLLRFSLPVDPWYQTESEVSTMWWLASKTDVPVPQIYFFDSSADNVLCLEWALMELVQGETLQKLVDKKPTLPLPAKGLIGKQINRHLQEIRDDHPFDQIGSLYCSWATGQFSVGRLVEWEFFKGKRLECPAPRGPFGSVPEYVWSLTEFQKWDIVEEYAADCEYYARQQEKKKEEKNKKGKKNNNDVDDDSKQDSFEVMSPERVAHWSAVINDQLMPLLMPRLEKLPTGVEHGGPIDGWYAELAHPDLHMGNVLVGADKRLSSIIDWDWSVIMPAPLVQMVPYMDTYFQGIPPSLRIPNPSELQLREILTPGGMDDVETDYFRSMKVSDTFAPPARYITPRALALRAVGEIVKNVMRLDKHGMDWLRDALEFLCRE